jgi:hypothetical protein
MPLTGSHATVTGGVAAFVVETPGGKAGHARDIATLKGPRSR